MRLDVGPGPGSELDALRAERDEWRRRAESALSEERAAPAHRPARRSAHVFRGLLATSFLAVVLVLSAGLLVGRSGATSLPDYPACIGKARYQHPVQGNQYQELVNALYTCDVYSAG
jgi:hypothetical protein